MNKDTQKLFTVHSLKVEDIDADAEQPRTEITGIEELAASMATFGQLTPILVRKTGNRYRIIGGERRWTAAQVNGDTTIYAYVADSDDAEVALLELADNQHVSLTDAEKSRGAQRAFTYDIPIERVAVAVGRDADALTKARRGFSRVNDPAATETLSLDRLIAIDEIADSDEDVTKLINAAESNWEYTFSNIKRERKTAIDVEAAKKLVADAGCELLTTTVYSPAGYSYLELQTFNAKTAVPEGAIAARIESYGSVSITWYSAAQDDSRAAEEAAKREERDKMRAELEASHTERLAFMAAKFEFAADLKKLAESVWENGAEADSLFLGSGPFADVRGFTARVTAALLAGEEEAVRTCLRDCDDTYSAQWQIQQHGEGALALLDAITRLGYKPGEAEAARIKIVREKVKQLVAARKKKAEEAAAVGVENASCRTCWHNDNDCEGAEADCGECEEWTATEPDGDEE